MEGPTRGFAVCAAGKGGMKVRNQIRFAVWMAAIVALSVVACFASEVAVLKNGFAIKHVRREVLGTTTRLYMSGDGSSFVDVPTADIEHFETAPDDSSSASGLSDAGVAAHASGFPARPHADLNEVVNEASGRYRLDPDLVNSVIKAESGFNARAVSRKGAQGLMQLMPGTASQLGVPDAFDAQANVEGGAKYLRALLEKYNFDLIKALAAYNAGPQRVEQFGGVPPYYETRAYVARVVRDFNKKKTAQQRVAASQKKTAAAGRSETNTHPSVAKAHEHTSTTVQNLHPAQTAE